MNISLITGQSLNPSGIRSTSGTPTLRKVPNTPNSPLALNRYLGLRIPELVGEKCPWTAKALELVGEKCPRVKIALELVGESALEPKVPSNFKGKPDFLSPEIIELDG